MIKSPSRYQSAIFDWIRNGKGNAIVEAVAGSGKTTTLISALELMNGKSPIFLAFNKHIAVELSHRAPAFAKVCTIHSLGFAALRKAVKNITVDGDKIRKIVAEVMGDDADDRLARIATERLASITRLTLSDDDPETLRDLMETYDIDCNGDEDWVVESIPDVLKRDREMTTLIDFDDMVYLPARLNIAPDYYDWVCVDEAQDLNAAQRSLVLRARTPKSGRMLFVGDSRQAIYGFAGASTDSMTLIAKETKAKTLPLSICYRCPTSHLDLAREIVPQIEARPDAPAGNVETITPEEMSRRLADGDLVICRVNAPLVEGALAAIRAGKKATMRGRDIGGNLVNLVKRIERGCGDDVVKFLAKASEYCDKETKKFVAQHREGKAQALLDKIETLAALADGIGSVSGLKSRIESIFSDDVGGIVFSSVHRAKGLEANRVAIFEPRLMPHPRAKEGWEQEQEQNLKYVALTRAKSDLWFVPKK